MHRIMVIDDDQLIVDVVKTAAIRNNLWCFGTVDPHEFLAAINDDVTLTIIDLRIPRFDGVQILRMLKTKGYNGKLVFMSGTDDRIIETAEALAREFGFVVSGRLKKPFAPEHLDAVLLDETQAAPPPAPRQPAQIFLHDLTNAIENELFVLHFQPQVFIETNKIFGVEALVRIQHPDKRLIYPDQFIPLAEENELIDAVGWCVTKMAFDAIDKIRKEFMHSIRFSVNVSVRSLADLGFPDKMLQLAIERGVAPSEITLEITESGKIDDLTSLMETLVRLRVMNFHLSLDDFGTGHAMMEQLQRVPAREIKIDRQFVHQMDYVESSKAVVKSTIDLGHELKMIVVAEGVEKSEQLQVLRQFGCDVAQGYLFSRPVPLNELFAWHREFVVQTSSTEQQPLE